jgi:hypothetical protein
MTAPATGFYSWIASVTANVGSGERCLYAFRAENRNAVARYLQFWDTADGVAGHGTLIDSIEMWGTSSLIVDTTFLGQGLRFATGLVFAWSTTQSTYTAATAADHTFAARFGA